MCIFNETLRYVNLLSNTSIFLYKSIHVTVLSVEIEKLMTISY